jgi:subtilisin family serine protease
LKVPRLALAAVLVLLVQPGAIAAQSLGDQAAAADYVVLYANGASTASAHGAIQAAGGVLVKENTDIGVATVRSANPRFLLAVAGQAALAGAARNVAIGREAPLARPSRDVIEKLTAAERAAAAAKPDKPGKPGKHTPAAEPLADLQWDMAMIHATADGSYKKQPGDPGVRVGILDTGIDGTHPDIAPNFDAALSRNFVTDIPAIDGPCEHPSCVDPVNEDDDGHGTHVAGTIGAAINGIGIAGVAPNVTLVNIRAGQDSGYFFLQPTVDALTYAADNGIDVVNMSYYIDPWLYNCASNPADSPAEQMEQRTIIEATNRALDYADKHGVTLIAAEGNGNTDLDNITFDGSSPDYPPNTEHDRTVDNSCVSMPAQGHHVINVAAVGPSTNKAYYSNWGYNETTIAAPGGSYRDYPGTPQFRTPENLILSAYPESLAWANGDLNPDGSPNSPFVVRDCEGGTCAYYQYLQGTSMASPHAVGVAALIVSEFGHKQKGKDGKDQLTMKPKDVEKVLTKTATEHACPNPPLISYADAGLPPSYDALCVGNAKFNSIWGNGIVDALAAVSGKK